jgi:hypothetical protein
MNGKNAKTTAEAEIRNLIENWAMAVRNENLDGSQPDAWRYVTEVQDAGKPADVTGYR